MSEDATLDDDIQHLIRMVRYKSGQVDKLEDKVKMLAAAIVFQ